MKKKINKSITEVDYIKDLNSKDLDRIDRCHRETDLFPFVKGKDGTQKRTCK